MRICILTPRFPYPENGGDVLRINNVARYLKSRHHQVILVSFCENNHLPLKQAYELYDKIYTIRRSRISSLIWSFLYLFSLRPIQCGYYHSIRYKRLLKRIIKYEQPDLFIAHLIRMAPYLDNKYIRKHSIIEMTDALSKTYSFFLNDHNHSFMSIVYKNEYKRALRYEKYVAAAFPKSVLVSDSDIQYLLKQVPQGNLSLYTNGILVANKPNNVYNPDKICFVGNMRTMQNRDAVLFFAQEVFPIILNRKPNAVFYIVGAQPPEMISRLADNKHIVVTNFVENVELVIADACLCVAPIRIAAGIQNKVLVSMGQNVPIVLTSLIATPIPELKNRHNCLIADTREQIAEACIELMNNPELREQIAQNGYSIAKEYYDWNAKLKGYELLDYKH